MVTQSNPAIQSMSQGMDNSIQHPRSHTKAPNTVNNNASPFKAMFSNDILADLGNNPTAQGMNQTGGGLSDLLSSMGMDSLELSPDTDFKLQYAQSQFQINYQSIQAINTANGIETKQINFSMSASFEYLNMASGQPPQSMTNAVEGGKPVSPMDRMMEMFSPEKTAQRILDFALNFFPKSSFHEEGGNTEETRQQFSDFIGKAIQRGFDEAMGILGNLPQSIQEDVDKTHDIVFKGLQDFVQNGLPESSQKEGGTFAQIEAYRIQLSIKVEQTSIQYQEYDANGHGAGSPAHQASTMDMTA